MMEEFEKEIDDHIKSARKRLSDIINNSSVSLEHNSYRRGYLEGVHFARNYLSEKSERYKAGFVEGVLTEPYIDNGEDSK